MTVYTKHVERGTGLGTGLHLWGVSGAAAPFLWVRRDGGGYFARHNNGVSIVSATGLAAPSAGDVVELVIQLYADGAIQARQSINSAAEVVGSKTAALTLAGAWDAEEFWLNSFGATGPGYADFESVKLASGIHSLETMRAIGGGGGGALRRLAMPIGIGI
jgi:ABC-type glycerol-3-phosphate transport system substrate-binding protein